MTNNFDEIDIELLIGEVKKYPELWNIEQGSYGDRTKKRAAWANICSHFSEDFDKKPDEEKNELCNIIVKRWKNIKDTYYRRVKKKMKSGQFNKSNKEYIYANQLSFLDNVITITETQRSLEDPWIKVDSEQLNCLKQKKLKQGVIKTHLCDQNFSSKRDRELQNAFYQFTRYPVPQSFAVTDPNADRSFFDSIIPSIRDFTEDQKLEFRFEVISLIKRIRKSYLSNNEASPHASSVPNLHYAMPNFFQPPYLQPSNFSSNLFPEGLSFQIPKNSYSSPNISAFPNNYFSQHNPSTWYPSPYLLNTASQHLSPQTEASSARCSTPLSSSIDLQSNSDDGNTN